MYALVQDSDYLDDVGEEEVTTGVEESLIGVEVSSTGEEESTTGEEESTAIRTEWSVAEEEVVVDGHSHVHHHHHVHLYHSLMSDPAVNIR